MEKNMGVALVGVWGEKKIKKCPEAKVGCRPCESEWREEGGERREEGKMWRKVFGTGGEKKNGKII